MGLADVLRQNGDIAYGPLARYIQYRGHHQGRDGVRGVGLLHADRVRGEAGAGR
jgi:hypothetical protein